MGGDRGIDISILVVEYKLNKNKCNRRYCLSTSAKLFSEMFSISRYVSPDNQIRKKSFYLNNV